MIPTYSKDGHLFFKEIKDANSILGDRLIIDPKNIDVACDYIKNNGIKSITINPAYFKVENLEFLKKISFIEGLYILQDNLDLSYINELHNLRVLTLNETKQFLDFNNFPNLEVLGITYSKFLLNINTCKKLFWLWFDNYKQDNLESLSGLSSLKYLKLHKALIRNLTGLDQIKPLFDLYVDTAPKLESLQGISEKNVDLKIINIYVAKNLNDYSAIIKVKSLEKLWIRKTGDIGNISFLQELPNLVDVIIGMKVLDGNINYIKEISNCGFVDFPHYNLKMKDMKKIK